MGRVADILAHKGAHVHIIARHATVFEALEKMVRHDVGSLVVMEGDSIAGIFTERDFLRRVALVGRNAKATPVDSVMTDRIVCLDPDWTVEECMAVMTHQRIRHLPVMHEGQLVGLVSIGDLVRYASHERQVEVRYLTDYIAGKYPG